MVVVVAAEEGAAAATIISLTFAEDCLSATTIKATPHQLFGNFSLGLRIVLGLRRDGPLSLGDEGSRFSLQGSRVGCGLGFGFHSLQQSFEVITGTRCSAIVFGL